MNPFIGHLKATFELYNQRFESDGWVTELSRANRNVRVGSPLFDPHLPPYFYSGQLLQFRDGELAFRTPLPSVIFITMNPQTNDHVDAWQPGGRTLREFVEFQNEWFASSAAMVRRPSTMYLNCRRFLSMLLGVDDVTRYGVLHRHAVAIDWFPFYSAGFSLSITNELPREYLQRTLAGIAAAADDYPTGPRPLVICMGKHAATAVRRLYQFGKRVGDHIEKFAPRSLSTPVYTFARLGQQGVPTKVLEEGAAALWDF